MLYTTLHGAIGVFVPFVSREDVDFFTHLEMHVRQENNPLCGRDHLAYRSFYFPVKVRTPQPPRRFDGGLARAESHARFWFGLV